MVSFTALLSAQFSFALAENKNAEQFYNAVTIARGRLKHEDRRKTFEKEIQTRRKKV